MNPLVACRGQKDTNHFVGFPNVDANPRRPLEKIASSVNLVKETNLLLRELGVTQYSSFALSFKSFV